MDSGWLRHLLNNRTEMITRFLLLLLLLACFRPVQAQTVSGRLKSPEGTPLRSATIQVKGKQLAYQAFTNRAGECSMLQVQPGDTLLFSFIGYHTAYYIAGETDTYIEGVMKPAALELCLRKLKGVPNWFYFGEGPQPQVYLALSRENILPLRSSKPVQEEEGCYFTTVIVGPSMNFGLDKWNKLLETGIAAPRRGPKGQLEIAFVVDKEGRTHDIVIEKSYHRKLDRLITDYLFGHIKMWGPAVQNGFVAAVPCRLRFEVTTPGGTIHLRSIYNNSN